MKRADRSAQRRRALATLAAVTLLAVATVAFASGPRWVTGAPYFTTVGQPVVWFTQAPTYYTDSGDLSASVDHAAADALVSAAATVWNVPTASFVIAQGGQLAEHVSSENVYLGSNGLVSPQTSPAPTTRPSRSPSSTTPMAR